jgi:hypothetical protein
MASSLSANFEQRLRDAMETDKKSGDQKATTALMQSLASYKSPWEEAKQAQLNRQGQIQAHVDQKAATEADHSYAYTESALTRLAAPVEQQAREIGQLSQTLQMGTPAADALVAPQMIRVIEQMNRSSEPEMARVLGGRSA